MDKLKRGIRLLFSYSLLSYMVFHGLAIILLVLPVNAYTDTYRSLVGRYALPFFPQVWLLFGPQFNGAENKLYFRCMASEGPWMPWQDPLASVLASSQNQRLGPDGYLYRAVDGLRLEVHNALYHLREQKQCKSEDLACQQQVKAELEENAYYKSLVRIIAESCDTLLGQQGWKQADMQIAWIRTKAIGDRTPTRTEEIASEYFAPFLNPSTPLSPR